MSETGQFFHYEKIIIFKKYPQIPEPKGQGHVLKSANCPNIFLGSVCRMYERTRAEQSRLIGQSSASALAIRNCEHLNFKGGQSQSL